MNKRFLGEVEQMIVAAVLRLGDEAYGVSIIDEIARHTGRTLGSGALSVALDRMEQKGLLVTRSGDAQERRGGRPRRYVEVTADGLAAAREARSAMLSLWEDLGEVYEG